MAISPLSLIKKGAAALVKDGKAAITKVESAFAPQKTLGVIKNTVTGVPRETAALAKSSASQTKKGLNIIKDVIVKAPTPKAQVYGINDAKNNRSKMVVLPGIDPTGVFGLAEKVPLEAAKIASEGSRALSALRQTPKAEKAVSELGTKGISLPGISKGATQLAREGISGIKSLEGTIPEKFNPASYVAEQVGKRESARGPIIQGLKAKTGSFLSNAKSKLVDFTAPIEDVLAEATKKSGIKLKPSEDIHNQIDRVLRAPTLAGQFVKDSGLEDVIRKVPDLDTLDQYLIARHGTELNARGITTGRDVAKDKALIDAVGETYKGAADTVVNYSRKLLDYSVDSGLISKGLADSLKERYPDYVPFSRVFSELEKSDARGAGGGVASLSRQTAVQKIVGSERDIESPIESLLGKTGDVFKQGEKNIAAKMLAGYEKLPGNPFGLKELKAGEKGAHTISYFEDGVKKTYETSKEIADAAKSLNVQQLNILGKIFALPTRIARIGLTGVNLPFIGANIVRDQATAVINSDRALKTSLANPGNFVRSLFSAIKHDDLYEEMVRAGGGGTSFDIARDQAAKTVKEIRRSRNLPGRAVNALSHPIRTVEDLVGRAEELTRIQQYRGTKNAMIAEGMPESEAVIGGARAARDTTINFARRGEWGTVLNSAFLYLNAGIQGSRTFLRVAKNRPLATAAKVATTIFTPVAVATAWNLSDPDRKKAYEDIPAYEKENNLIIVPSNPTQDADGNWNVIKIPLEQATNELANLVRRPIEAAEGLDPIKFKDIYNNLLGVVSPVDPQNALSTLVPQAIKPALEAKINKSLFTGYPIVPQGLQNLSPENQVRENTSGTARMISKVLNVSPIQTETFIKSTFGGVGSQAINAFDNTFAALGAIPKEQVGGQSPLEGIIGRFAKAHGGATEQAVEDDIDAINRDRGDKKATEIKPIYDQAMELNAAGKTAEAQALVDGLTDDQYELYKEVYKAENRKKTEQTKRDILPIYKQAMELNAQGKTAEAQSLVDGLTDDEYKAYVAVHKQFEKDQRAAKGEKPTYEDGETQTKSTVLNTVVTYAKALKVDPATAFKAMFSKEQLNYVDGNVVTLKRIPAFEKGGSEDIANERAKEQGVDRSAMRLDHTVPLELGGSNAQSNLNLITKEQWASYTPIENLLGDAVRDKKISRSTAQKLIKQFKNGKITADEVRAQVP